MNRRTISETINLGFIKLDIRHFERTINKIFINLSFLLFFCTIVAGFFVNIDTTSQIHGYLDANDGNMEVQASSSGILDKWTVKHGDIIKKGDAMGFISLEKIGVNGDVLSSQNIQSLEQQKKYFTEAYKI